MNYQAQWEIGFERAFHPAPLIDKLETLSEGFQDGYREGLERKVDPAWQQFVSEIRRPEGR